MKHFSSLIPISVILVVLISLAGGRGAIAADDTLQIKDQSIPDSYILHFTSETSAERIQEIIREAGATVEQDIPQINTLVVSTSTTGGSKTKIFSQYDEIVSYEPNYTVSSSMIPDDPDLTQQWGLTQIQASKAWDLTEGDSNVKIAILDSGIDSSHPDLASKVVEKKNFTDSTTTEDKFGHGTHVAGIAAAITDNNSGIAGVACNASLMNVKVLGDNGNGSYSNIIQGIIWAADNGANIINMSISGTVDSQSLKDAVDYAWNKGVVIVVAAGNSGNSTMTYPASYENCIAVAATDSKDNLFGFSDYGNWIDVTAPGDALSTIPGNNYGTMQGTSMASPFVSGLAGLAFAVAKDTDGDGYLNDEVREAIESGCDKVTATGTGSGRINAYRTISSLMNANTNPSPAPNTFGLSNGDSIWNQTGNILDVMRFQNTSGTGILTKLELLVSDNTPSGKARLGVYADNYGKPGNRLLDAGEVDVKNGWVSISGLALPVTENSYYWLAFELQNTNGAAFLSGTENVSQITHYWINNNYGPLPATFKMAEASSNFSPYVMRATVTTR